MVLDRINFLKDEINKANYKYYVEDNPSISDFEYDQMFAELNYIVLIILMNMMTWKTGIKRL